MAGGGWCTQGAGGTSVDQRHAHHPGRDECIYGALIRPGQGRAGAETVPEQDQNQCQDQARTVPEPAPAPPDPPDTRHATPGT